MGYHAALALEQMGVIVVAVSDSRGGPYNPRGMDLPLTLKIKQQSGSCKDYPDGDIVTNTELLGLPVDALIPSAIEGQINDKTAESVKAKLIVEGANGPTAPEADKILVEKGSLVIPDILGECRWRNCLLFRMGSKLPIVFLGPIFGSVQFGQDDQGIVCCNGGPVGTKKHRGPNNGHVISH